MGKDAAEVQPFDLQRMLLGDVSWWFTLEIVFRTVLMYLFALLLIRLISKRVVGQLSIGEFMMIVALGSSVGDPMFYADVPLLHGMVVIAVVVFLNRVVLMIINRSDVLEDIVEGFPVELIQHGIINVEGLRQAVLSREKLFEKLRGRGIECLGEVRYACLEQGGDLSVFRESPNKPSLRILPPWDIEAPNVFDCDVSDNVEATTWLGCDACGTSLLHSPSKALPSCPNCGNNRWVDAVCVGNEQP